MVKTKKSKLGLFKINPFWRCDKLEKKKKERKVLVEMGQGYLRRIPITNKTSDSGSDEFSLYGVSAMEGRRWGMEDAHSTIVKRVLNPGGPEVSFYAIFDGHSGPKAALHFSATLGEKLLAMESNRTRDVKSVLFSDDESIIKQFLASDKEFSLILEKEDIKRDEEKEEIKRDEEKKGNGDRGSGTTCISCFVVPQKNGDLSFICCNVGDSRAILYDNGTVVELSEDHKPSIPLERERIEGAGGVVVNDRVDGSLAMSRALGDFMYKTSETLSDREQKVVAVPEIKRYTMTKPTDGELKFLVLACDGVWYVMGDGVVCDFIVGVLNRQAAGYDIVSICEKVLDHCVMTLWSEDNASITIVLFN